MPLHLYFREFTLWCVENEVEGPSQIADLPNVRPPLSAARIRRFYKFLPGREEEDRRRHRAARGSA